MEEEVAFVRTDIKTEKQTGTLGYLYWEDSVDSEGVLHGLSKEFWINCNPPKPFIFQYIEKGILQGENGLRLKAVAHNKYCLITRLSAIAF